jgi:tetratricopeptide (TPR) repeat protein
LGDILQSLGETSAAEANYAKAIQLFETLSRREPGNPQHDSDLVEAQRNLGSMFRQTRRRQRAHESLERAVSLAKNLSDAHSGHAKYQHDLAVTYNELGLLWQDLDQYEKAQAAHGQAIAIEEKLARQDADEGGKYAEGLAHSFGLLGTAYRRNGRHDDGRTALHRSVELYDKLAGRFPSEAAYESNLAYHCYDLGNLELDAGRPREAETPLKRAANIQEKLTRAHPDVIAYLAELANTYSSMARCQNSLGKPDGVLAWADKSIQVLRGVLDKEPRNNVAQMLLKDTRVGRAVALAQMGDYGQAARDADDLSRQEGLSPVDIYNLACIYSRCFESAGKDSKLSNPERNELQEQYGGRTTASLRRALAIGFRNTPVFRTDPDLQAVQDRDDFKKLLKEVEKK